MTACSENGLLFLKSITNYYYCGMMNYGNLDSKEFYHLLVIAYGHMCLLLSNLCFKLSMVYSLSFHSIF